MLTVTLLLFSPLALLFSILNYNWHHHCPTMCVHLQLSSFLAQPSGDLERIGLTVGAPLSTADLGGGEPGGGGLLPGRATQEAAQKWG